MWGIGVVVCGLKSVNKVFGLIYKVGKWEVLRILGKVIGCFWFIVVI